MQETLSLEQERDRLEAELARIRERRKAVRQKRARVQASAPGRRYALGPLDLLVCCCCCQSQLRPLCELKAEWLARVNAAETELTAVQEELLSVEVERR